MVPDSRIEASTSPIFEDVGVIALVYHDWKLHWLTPHHVLPRLAKYFHVVWVNPVHEWRQTRVRTAFSSKTFTSEVEKCPAFSVYRPEAWLPKLYRPRGLAQFAFTLRVKRAWQELKRRGCKKLILYIWHPQFEEALRGISYDFSCYHIDDDYSFEGIEGPVSETENRLIKSVDHVFITSPGLMENRGQINPATTFVPEGVDFQAYSTPADLPEDMAGIPYPIIGYTGFLKRQLNWQLFLEMSNRHQKWSFVLVGPENRHSEIVPFLEELRNRPNVHFLGPKTVNQLVAYPQHFDVCIMPYQVNAYTNQIYPLKLHEYLATGHPVVASPIRSLQAFSHVVRFANSMDEWSEALEASLTPEANSCAAAERRRHVARQHDWEGLVQIIAGTMSQGLGFPANVNENSSRCRNL